MQRPSEPGVTPDVVSSFPVPALVEPPGVDVCHEPRLLHEPAGAESNKYTEGVVIRDGLGWLMKAHVICIGGLLEMAYIY